MKILSVASNRVVPCGRTNVTKSKSRFTVLQTRLKLLYIYI